MRCPACGATFLARGKQKRACPKCGADPKQEAALQDRLAKARSEFQASGTGNGSRQTKTCPMCAEEVLVAAKICKHCGNVLDKKAAKKEKAAKRRTTLAAAQPAKHPGAALVLSFLYPGLGHMYAGKFGTGLVIALVPWLIFVPMYFFFSSGEERTGWLLLLVFFLFHWFQVFAAYRTAERHNRERAARMASS